MQVIIIIKDVNTDFIQLCHQFHCYSGWNTALLVDKRNNNLVICEDYNDMGMEGSNFSLWLYSAYDAEFLKTYYLRICSWWVNFRLHKLYGGIV